MPVLHSIFGVLRSTFGVLLLCSALLRAEPTTYIDHLRPILKDSCLNCHNPDKKKADLDLSTYDALLAGGSGGEVVKAGVPDSSSLYLSVTHHDDWESMPPKKSKLSDEKLAVFRNWIADGLIDSKDGPSKLRKVEFNIAGGSANKPDGPPPMPPTELSPVTPSNLRPPSVHAMAVSPWAPLVAVSGHEEILLFHTESQQWLGALPFPEGTIHTLKFSRNGQLLLAGGGRGAHSGKVVIYDITTAKRVAEIGDEEDAVLAADISADHQFIALGGPNKIVKIFSLKDGTLLHRITSHTDWITALAFAPEGNLLATADRNGGIHIWEADTAAIVFSLSEHKIRVTDLEWRPDSKMLASVAEDGKLILWDMSDGWPAKVVDAHQGKSPTRYTRATGVLSVHWATNGELLTTGRDRTLRLWKPDGNKLKVLPALTDLPTCSVLTQDNQTILTGTLQGTLVLTPRDAPQDSQTAPLP